LKITIYNTETTVNISATDHWTVLAG